MKRIMGVISLSCALLLAGTNTALVYADADSSPTLSKKFLFKKNLNDFAYSLALQAATWGLPVVVMYNLRYNDALKPEAKSKPNQIWRLENITSPSLSETVGYATPNVNVLYGFGFLDLSKEPIIVNAPDSNNHYYLIQLVDMYTNSFAYIGGVTTGYKGGTFAIVGPGWQGTLPAGMVRIDAPTPWILIQPRVHVAHEEELANARKILNEITVKGLAEYTGKTPLATSTYNYLSPEYTDSQLPVSVVGFKDPLQFWRILSAAINENPPPKDQITALLPLFKLLGIEYGKQWDPAGISPIILDAMQEAVQQISPVAAKLPVGTFVNNWFIPPSAIGNAQNDYYLRALTARVRPTANIPKEAVYFISSMDSTTQDIMSNKKYTVTLKKLPVYIKPGFWSLTVYAARTNYPIENPIHRYSLGSDNKMQMNLDGSLTLYLQNVSPGKDKESNWLPTGNDEQSLYLVLRTYAPGQEMIDALSNPQQFLPPEIIETK